MGCAFLAWVITPDGVEVESESHVGQVTGRITQILTQKSGCISKFEGKLEELNEYINFLGSCEMLIIATDLWMQGEFPKNYETRFVWDFFNSQNERRDVVSKVTLFNLCETSTQREVCYRLGHLYKTKGTKIFDESERSSAIYIVRFGVVSIMNKKMEIMRAQRGDLVGEAGILGLTPNENYGFTAMAETMCELCVLNVKDFQDMLVQIPDFFRVIERVLYYHVIQLESRVHSRDAIDRSDKWMINWEAIARAFKAESAVFERCASGTDSKENESLLLTTQFHFQLQSIEGAGLIQGNLFFVRLEFTSCSEIACNAVADGPVFDLEDVMQVNGKHVISQTVRFVLRHSHNDWTLLPDVKISIHKICMKNRFGRTVSKGFHVDSFEYALKANSREVWQGRISWKLLVDNRCASQEGFLDQKLVSLTLIPTNVHELAPCKLWFSVNASRLLRNNSRWRQILDILRKTSASPYFAQKQIDSIASLRGRIEENLRVLRIQRMEHGNSDVYKALKDWALPCNRSDPPVDSLQSPPGETSATISQNNTKGEDGIEQVLLVLGDSFFC
eukprot:139802-Hanusia_phi.AAC.4